LELKALLSEYTITMSAKSTAGPGGKKPASAATNLIGELPDEEPKRRSVTDLLAQLVEVQV
jgi:hypothetical protein